MSSTAAAARSHPPYLSSSPFAWPQDPLDEGPAPEHPRRSTLRPGPRHPFTLDAPARVAGLLSLHGVHVMLVEDNADARNIIRRVLEYCGALVSVAETATGALRRLRAMVEHPSVLLSDIALPGKDGYWLIREIRASQQLSRLPSIAITAHRNEYDREDTLAAGFHEYFQKPLDLVAFCRAVGRLAGRPPDPD